MKRIAGIDGLRGIAVLLVFAVHATLPVFKGGGIGVDIFFAISGFLITKTFNNDGNDLVKFWFYRFFRIYPPLIAAAAISVTIFYFGRLAGAVEAADNLLPSLLGVANFARITIGAPTFLGHLWSVGIEEQFYLGYPVALLLILRRRPGGAAGVLFGAACLLAVYRLGLFQFLHLPVGDLFNRTDTRIDGLLWGAGLALLPRERLTVVARAWPASAAFLCAAALYQKWWHSWLYLGGFSLLSICTCVLLAELATAPRSPLTRALSFRPLSGLGEVSYGFYLWHLPVIHLTGKL
ncbi:MAG TPA: acyltransferase, partial [Elusimicrobiales bacterium]|nr:acyltransferase [Elusimicrobiales bacterium]